MNRESRKDGSGKEKWEERAKVPMLHSAPWKPGLHVGWRQWPVRRLHGCLPPHLHDLLHVTPCLPMGQAEGG